MAAGVPVLGSTLAGAVHERVVNGRNGLLVEPASVEDLARAISFLAENTARIADMGREARRTAEEWPVERGIETIYRLLDAHRP
jgi:glycosyltransferase involved in cell wall biosynthesis